MGMLSEGQFLPPVLIVQGVGVGSYLKGGLDVCGASWGCVCAF
jgi:hypothetical protein